MFNELRADPDRPNQGRTPDEGLDIVRRYDGLIAEAKGDAPLREFWRLSKHIYQEDIAQVRDGPVTNGPTGWRAS
jgi:hypothetical protein